RVKAEKFAQFHLLHSVSAVLSSSLEPEVLVKGTLTALINGLNADAGVVYLNHPEGQAMRVVAAEGFAASQEAWDGSLLDLFFRTAAKMNGAPLILESFNESSRLHLANDTFKEIQALACAPLGTQGVMTGAICLVSGKRYPFPKQC